VKEISYKRISCSLCQDLSISHLDLKATSTHQSLIQIANLSCLLRCFLARKITQEEIESPIGYSP
jgi:hypothetical protein